jgi:TRAP-type C4-dicarboxylate transport system permease small subunit
MKPILSALDAVVTAAAWVAGLATVLMMLHVTADVIGRNVFNNPITGTIEIVSAYNMAALSFLPLALIAREKGHIIVELFTTWMQARPRRILDGLVGIVTFIYTALFTWKAVEVAIDKTGIREAKEAGIGFVEIWPARWLVAFGFGLMALYVLVHIFRDLRAGRRAGEAGR